MNERYMKDRITIYDVAKSAKVSLATVSRVINGQVTVKEATRLRVEKTIEQLGYKPSALAQSLASNKSANVAIIIPSSYNTYISLILAGMLDVAKIYGYKTCVFTINRDATDYYEVLELVIKARVDGAIIYHPELPQEAITHLEKFKMPIIVIGESNKIGDKIGSVVIDFKITLKNLLLKYEDCDKKIFFVNSSNIFKDIKGEVINFLEENDDYIVQVEDSYNNTYQHFLQEFKKGNYKNSLLITQRDTIGIAIINAAVDLGLKIPEEIEVLSIIDTRHSIRVRPKLSSLYIDLYEVGSIGMRMLTKLLSNKLKDKNYTFTSQYVKRETTKI